MTIAHPGADHCALCLVHGALMRDMEEWPGAPCCRQHVAESIEANEPKVIYPPSGFAAPPPVELW
jgi:hypothetical protein